MIRKLTVGDEKIRKEAGRKGKRWRKIWRMGLSPSPKKIPGYVTMVLHVHVLKCQCNKWSNAMSVLPCDGPGGFNFYRPL